jgi:hypothetical protein
MNVGPTKFISLIPVSYKSDGFLGSFFLMKESTDKNWKRFIFTSQTMSPGVAVYRLALCSVSNGGTALSNVYSISVPSPVPLNKMSWLQIFRCSFHIAVAHLSRTAAVGHSDVFFLLYFMLLYAAIQGVTWLRVSTSGSYSWGHSQSEISYKHRYDSQRFRSYGYFKFKMICTLRRTSGSLIRLERHRTRQQMYFKRDGAPHISVDTWRSTQMSSSLTDGLVVVVLRIGHCGHRTSLPQISIKSMLHERKSNKRRNYIIEFLMLQDAFILNFKYPSSVTLRIGPMFIWHFWLGMTSGIRSWSIDMKPCLRCVNCKMIMNSEEWFGRDFF